jgi:fumarylacetoacetase
MSKPELDDPTQLKKQKIEDMAAATPAAAAASMHAQDISLDKIPPSAVVPAATTKSWIPYSAESHFPLQNLPYGVFTRAGDERRRIGVAIGEQVVDLYALTQAGLFASLPDAGAYFAEPTLNAFMQQGRAVWKQARALLTALLQEGSGNTALSGNAELRTAALVAQSAVKMHMPATIGDYTDFYSSKYHAYNVGVMFRGKDNALQPNWTWLPVGYHGRSSSVVVSGEGIHRPNGQLQPDESKPPVFGTCKLLDFELEMAAFVGGPGNKMGQPLTSAEAEASMFGLVVMNDWSARDIQKWEYVPLGPFTAKNFGTTISPWIVTMEALEPFRVPNQEQIPAPMAYLSEQAPMTYDIHLDVTIQSEKMTKPAVVSRSNAKYLYWTLKQQLVHHSVSGCPMRAGDLLGTGTISGPQPSEYGSMLELSWRGAKEVPLGEEGGVRKFLQDGDSVNMIGYAQAENYRVGFGDCIGKVLPAVKFP